MSSGIKFINEAYKAIYQNDFQKAIIAFQKAIKCDPSNASYYYKLSITCSRNSDIKTAIEAAQMACDLSPNNQTYTYHLQILQAKNLVLLAANKIDEGIFSEEVEKMLVQAKNLDPLNMETYLLLSIFYSEGKMFLEAIYEIDSALKLDPFHHYAKQLKKYYIKLSKEGEYDE